MTRHPRLWTHRIATLLSTLLLAVLLALASVLVQGHGPEQVADGNVCGPRGDGPCLRPALKGGFPVAYLVDRPGVSVEGKLSLGEDELLPAALLIDVAFYALLLALVLRAWHRRRGWGAKPLP